MKPQHMTRKIQPIIVIIVHLVVLAALELASAQPALALPKISIHTLMEDPGSGLTGITHLIIRDALNQSSHVRKVPSYLAHDEYVYPEGVDIAYTGVTYPFDNKEIWFNRSRTIAAVNLKPVVDICELYLVLSTRGGFLVMPDCNARIGAICHARNMPYEFGWLRVDSIKGRVITVESGKASISESIEHIRLLVSRDGQFRLLKYWRTHPTE